MPRLQKTTGFTLIEVMIVVAIIGILAAIAYPSYLEYVRDSRRSDAVAALLQLQLDQEKWRANNTTYTNVLQGTNCGTASATGLCWSSATSPDGYYNIAITGNSSTGYTATATAAPTGAQASDSVCSPMTLTVSTANPNGARSPADCFR